ncbi:MAG: tetratricopeptide repeat protein [Bacteroidota bacterium]
MKKHFILFLFLLVFSSAITAQVNISHFMHAGRYELSQTNYAESIKKFNIVITYKPELFEPYFLRGIAKLYLGDYQGAEQDLSTAVTIHPLYSHAYHYRAIARAQMYNYTNALHDFHKALEIDPFNPDIYIDRGLTRINMRSYPAAIEDLDEALKFDKTRAHAYLYRAIAKSSLEENESAIEDCNKALKLDYFNTDAYLKRGQIYYETESFDKAIADFNQILDLDPDNSTACFHRGLTRISMGDTAAAMSDFDKVIRDNPYNALTYYNRAWLKAGIKDYEGSLRDYNMVISINPNNVYAYYGRAYIYQITEKHRDAIADYTKCIELFPDFAGAYLQRSASKQYLNEHEAARHDHDKAFEIINMLNDGDASTDALMKTYADSTYFQKLIAFESDFNDGNMTGELNRAYEGIELQPNFTVQFVKKDKDFVQKQREGYTVKEITEYNMSNEEELTFAIMNADINENVDALNQHLLIADSMLHENSSNYIGHFLKGVVNGMAHNYTNSLEAYDNAITLFPKFVFAYFNRANTRYELEEYLYNERVYTDKVTITWDKIPAPRNEDIAKEPDFIAVLQDYDRVIQLKPKLPYAYFNRANIRCRMKDYHSAILDYSQAIKLESELAEAWFNRGLTYIYLDQIDHGCSDLSKAGELGIKDAYAVIKRFCYK